MDFKRIRKFLLFIIVIMSATGLVSCSEKNSGPDFNVLLITVDTLRPDHLGCYGYKTDCSPYMDELAASGIRFSNAWSQTNSTLPSHLSILTSSYIQDHGVFTNDVYYSKDLPSMDRLLGEAGLTTCGIVSVLHLGRAIGVGKHFDYFYDLKTNPPKVPSFQGKSRKADETTDIAVKWLQKHGKKPFFMWVHYFDPHMPYYPPEPYRSRFLKSPLPERVSYSFQLSLGKTTLENVLMKKDWNDVEKRYFTAVANMELPLEEFHYNGIGVTPEEFKALNDLYDGEIAFADAGIGKLLDYLEQLGIKDKTIIVLTADHGESLGEHDIVASHRSLYSPTIRIPMMIAWPGKLPAGKVIDMPVQTLDIAPTVMALTGNEIPAAFRGENLAPYLEGEKACYGPGDRILRFEHANTGSIGFLKYNWKWIVSLAGQFNLENFVYRHKTKEIYNLNSDPDELNNLVEIEGDKITINDPEVVAMDKEFTSEYKSWYDSVGVHKIRSVKKVDNEELEESLRSLGYVQ